MKHGCERARTEHGHLLFLGSALAFSCHTVATRRVGLDGLHAAAFSAVGSTLVYMPPYAIAAGASGPRCLANRPSLQALVQELLTAVMSYIVYGSP
jgi:drug/metabolite transporter (DMT)-like permease